MTQTPPATPKPSGSVMNLGLAAALPWAAAMTLRYAWAMVPVPGEQRPPGLWIVFGALNDGFFLGDGAFPFWPLIGGLLALWLFTLIGRLFLLCFEIYLPRGARRVLALICGMALVGIALEVPAIFHWLYGAVVWAVLLLLILILWRASYLARRRAHPTSSLPDDARVLRRALENEEQSRYERSLLRPQTPSGKLFAWCAIGLIALITALTFYHALLYPVAYWDSLILYAGYARMTFLEHGFPVKVVAQVGIGLGANYPHLYALLGSTIASMFGHWSTAYQQLIAPAAGLATAILIYHTVLRMTRRTNLALAAALLFRAIPYGIAYSVYASDYALVILLAAAFLYAALLYIETGLIGWLAVLTLLTATGAHLNYLMNAMWGVWLVAVIAAHLPGRAPGMFGAISDVPPEEEDFSARVETGYTHREPRPALRQLLRSKPFWAITIAGIAATLPWHIRNIIVTGNPVYAFFSGLFGGKHINDLVMQSAFIEWFANGEGIGPAAAQIFGENTLWTRLKSSWTYFVLWPVQQNPWKLSPMLAAFTAPGILFWLWRMGSQARARNLDSLSRFGLVVAALFFGMLAYFYLLADFYLYQILAILPPIAIFIGFWPLGTAGRGSRGVFSGLIVLMGVMPGVAVALLGPKMGTPDLWAFRHPRPNETAFYRAKFPGEFEAIEFINANLAGEKLLTHDNRHLLYDPSITLVHLDDWPIQDLYDVASPDERADRLREMGIQHYLRVPMEARHPVNAMLGMDELAQAGRLEEIFIGFAPQSAGVRLYRLVAPQ